MFKTYFDFIEKKPKEAINLFGKVFNVFLALQAFILIVSFLLQF